MNRLLLFLLIFSQQSTAQSLYWVTDCTEKTFCFNQGSCTQSSVFLVEKAMAICGSQAVSYSYKIDLNNDGGIEIQSSEDTVKGLFNNGTHRIYWRASDFCGHVINCTYLFHVRDCLPPSMVCLNGLTQSLYPPLCEVTFDVDQFFLNLADNCTPTNQIEKGVRITGTGTGFPSNQSLTFGLCDNGPNLVEVWVRDGNGLTNICNNTVTIQSNDPICDCNEDSDLQFEGCARAANNVRLSNFRAQATVKTPDGVLPAFSKVKTLSTSDSCFSLLVNDLPHGADYEAVVRADRPDAVLNGVTTFDLVLISKHILGIEPLTSAYQLEAADVNNSNSVTSFDIVETRKVILGINDTFAQVPSWRLVRPLANPSMLSSFTALQDTYQVQLTNLQTNQSFEGFNFVGIKYGDVNYSAALTGALDDRTNAEPLLLEADDQWLKAGETRRLEFRLGDMEALDGWQIALSADPTALQLLSVEGLSESDYLLSGNELRAISYDGFSRKAAANNGVFALKIKALRAVQLSQALHLNTDKWASEAYGPGRNNEPLHYPIQLQIANQKAQNVSAFDLSPNPFTTQADFHVSLENAATAVLEIFTPDGRRVYAENFDLAKGTQLIRLTSESLPNGKMFFYRFFVNGAVFSGKMIRI